MGPRLKPSDTQAQQILSFPYWFCPNFTVGHPAMPRKSKIAIIVALVLSLALAIHFAVRDHTPAVALAWDLSPTEPVFVTFAYVLRVTNRLTVPIVMDTALVEWEDSQGRVSSETILSWTKWYLEHNDVAAHATNVPRDAQKARILCNYSLDGGRVRKVFGRCLAKIRWWRSSPRIFLPQAAPVTTTSRPPSRVDLWLYRNGYIDGRVHRMNEGRWVPNRT